MTQSPDPFGLERFVQAQAGSYPAALAEIRAGEKRTHWMWYVFPQAAGLGHSDMARRYAIRSAEEARAYLAHLVLGARYRECVVALSALPVADVVAVFGAVDAMKLCSSLDLFADVEEGESIAEARSRWCGVTRG